MRTKIFLILLAAISFALNMSGETPLKPFQKENGKWGYADKDNNVVIPCLYDSAYPFENGLAVVGRDGKFGYVDRFGTLIYPMEYELAAPFCQAHAFVVKDGLLGVLDISGKVSFDYERMKRFILPVEWAETSPRFLGNESGDFLLWVQQNQRYPEKAYDTGVSGSVEVEFTVGVDGKVCDVTALNSAFPELDKEAVRVVSSSPDWSPARVGSLAFRTKFSVIVNFTIAPGVKRK